MFLSGVSSHEMCVEMLAKKKIKKTAGTSIDAFMHYASLSNISKMQELENTHKRQCSIRITPPSP